MKGIQKRLGSLLMAAVMLLSLAVTPAMAAEEKEPPTAVKCEYTSSLTNTLTLTMNDSAWLAAVATKRATLTINELTYTYRDDFGMFCSDPYWHVKGNNIEFVVTTPSSFFPAVFTLSADGYKDVKITVSKTGNWPNESVSATVEIVDGSGSTEQPDTPEKGTIDLSKVSFAKSFDGNDWQVTFGEDGYAEKITAVTVNGKPWNATSFLADGGKYKISDGKLLFARNSYGGTAALKSGDVITITADGYEALTFKLVINTDGSASVEKNDGKGDPLELHVKLVGSFEAAIVGQKNYDGVSSASVGGASSNKNSAVTVYGALVKKGNDPTDKDWEELNHQSEIQLVGSKCSVSIVPDTEKGTPAAADSGMEGVYMTISSDLTLNGTPKDAGSYLISVHIEDNQGRTATSNALPFRIYTGEETLAD